MAKKKKKIKWKCRGFPHMLEGWRMRSEICFESWWELRTIMLCSVAGCCGMLMKIAPTFNTAALLVFSPRCALYKAWDFAMLHFTTVLRYKYTQTKGTYYKGSFWNHRLDVILNSNIKQCLWNMYRQILAKCTNEMFMWLETRPCRCRESWWKGEFQVLMAWSWTVHLIHTTHKIAKMSGSIRLIDGYATSKSQGAPEN